MMNKVREVERGGGLRSEFGPYRCPSCEAAAVWVFGVGWKCDDCGQTGRITFFRDRQR